MPPTSDNRAPLEDSYLENTTTRNAFYHAKILEAGSRYEVAVTFGKIGTKGQTRSQGRFNTITSARAKMNALIEKKKTGKYIIAKKRGKVKAKASEIKGKITIKSGSLSRFSLILE